MTRRSKHDVNPELSMWGRLAAHESWARTEDRAARTANARAALEQKFLDEAGGDPQRAESIRKAYFTRMSLRSAQARRRRREAAEAAGGEQS